MSTVQLDAAELFMRVAGASEETIAGARNSPMWPGLEAIAHTLAYDAACMGNGQPPTARLARITRPTLVATGGGSPDSFVGGGGDFFGRAADAIAREHPARDTADNRRTDTSGRPEGARSGARTVLQRMTCLRSLDLAPSASREDRVGDGFGELRG